MIKKTALSLPLFGLLAALLLPLPSRAAVLTLNLTLSNPAQFTAPDSVLSFIATVSAPLSNTGDVWLVSDSTSVDYPLTLDDSPFFLNFPLSLSPGDSYTGELFTVTVPDIATPVTTYNGYFEIDGGADSGSADYLTSATFQVTSTPEPGAFVLFGGGALVLGFLSRRRRAGIV